MVSVDDDLKLHPKTKTYLNEAPLEKRKDMGQYFTPRPIIHNLLAHLPDKVRKNKGLEILDPASGTGEFLLAAEKEFKNANLEGWEIDEELADISREILPKEAEITVTNTIFNQTEKEYDLIIGNPPYYEVKQTDKIKDVYDPILYGRTNIYSLFIYKGIRLLKDGGYLAYINPPSMNNGVYFKELRRYIANNCSIEHISIHEDSRLFEGASQPIMYFILKKNGNHNDYIFSKGDKTIFSEHAEYLQKEFKDKKTLQEAGYQVKTGSLEWDKKKSELREKPSIDTIPIIWSKNIVNGNLEIGENVHSKPQYIENYEGTKGPAVAVNRVIGKPSKGILRAALIPEGMEFVGENHINLIKPVQDKKQLISMENIQKQLNSGDSVEVVKAITGNKQVSKADLQGLFPFETGFM